jgi:hypothetical protein
LCCIFFVQLDLFKRCAVVLTFLSHFYLQGSSEAINFSLILISDF